MLVLYRYNKADTAPAELVMMVGVLGLEPRSLSALDFESSVFTNFTIPPLCIALF